LGLGASSIYSERMTQLLRPGGHVLVVFKTLHLLKLIPSFEDESEALASFQPLTYSAKP
jgi:hypothetical protein